MAKYIVTTQDRTEIGAASLPEVKALCAANPGSTVRVNHTPITNPCTAHPSYEADNCPVCGTSARIGA